MQDWLMILGGLVALVVSADLLVRGSVSIALGLGVRPMVVGLTVVAFGTSAPELAACLAGALNDASGLATGTVLGSNVANIGFILALVAVVKPISHPPKSAAFEVRALLAVTILSPIPMLVFGVVSRALGIALVVYLLIVVWLMFQKESRRRDADRNQDLPPRTGNWFIDVVLALAGLAGLKYGADWLIGGARSLAESAGISPVVIGALIVAVGTSLPELAASIAAAVRKQPEIVLGNVLGSNLFNLCMALGATAVIEPIPVSVANEGLHLACSAAFTCILGALLAWRHGVGRLAGALLLVAYAGYIALTMAS